MARRAHDRHWREFAKWCRRRRLRLLPAHPWTVAAFLRREDARDPATPPAAVLESIARMHLLGAVRSPHRHPVVTRTLAAIERRRATAGLRADLFEATDFLAETPPDDALAADGNPGAAETESGDGRADGEDEEDAAETPGRVRRLRARPRLVRRRPKG